MCFSQKNAQYDWILHVHRCGKVIMVGLKTFFFFQKLTNWKASQGKNM